MRQAHTRRAFLAATVTATAGCSYGDGDPVSNNGVCEEMVPVSIDVSAYSLLNLTSMEFAEMETFPHDYHESVPGVKFRLVNRGEEPVETGPKDHYVIQYTRGGDERWQHALHTVDPGLDEGETVTHRPGEGFTWEFVFDSDFHRDGYAVCGQLPERAIYRFVYLGLPPDHGSPQGAAANFPVPNPTVATTRA